jgi:hypothetical protein
VGSVMLRHAKSKRGKDAGSARIALIRARLRTPPGAALQPPERAGTRGAAH